MALLLWHIMEYDHGTSPYRQLHVKKAWMASFAHPFHQAVLVTVHALTVEFEGGLASVQADGHRPMLQESLHQGMLAALLNMPIALEKS